MQTKEIMYTGIGERMKIVVLGGGISTERHVSLVSATSVCKALRSIGHQAIFVDMFFGLENYEGDLDALFDSEDGLCGEVAIEHVEPDIEAIKASRKCNESGRLGKNVLEICKLADCVFLGLHGNDGEDGKIQAALDLLGIPYTGSGHLGSAMAMDKIVAKRIMRSAGIPCAPETDHAPCVVKCATGGSSIGVFICDTDEEYQEALEKVRKYGDSYIVEKKISGRELTVPVLDGKALSPIEIVPPESGKFDYVSKYQSGEEGAAEICPARLTEEETALVSDLAVRFHQALGLSVYSRTDFILDENGKAWCLETNTLPGMTPNSLIPKAARLEGLDYPHLCEKIVTLSLEKHTS